MTCLGETQRGLIVRTSSKDVLPFASEMLCEDSNHTFETSQDCTMNHDRSGISETKRFAICSVVLSLAVGCLVLQVEAFR
jgi:hypothetical protein